MNRSEFSSWLKDQRERHGMTLQELAREIGKRGYPLSVNKLWRLENNAFKKFNYELEIRLKAFFEEDFAQGTRQRSGEFVLVDDVVELIGHIANQGKSADVPHDPLLRRVYNKLLEHLRTDGIEQKLNSIQTDAPGVQKAGYGFGVHNPRKVEFGKRRRKLTR